MNEQDLIALECELAEALGFREIEIAIGKTNNWRPMLIGLWGEQEKRKQHVPMWARDWSACGPLMVEHFITTMQDAEEVIAGRAREIYLNHPDRDTAVRVAICRAVLAKLKGTK